MTRERCSEGWAVDKLRMVNQKKPQHRKWTPEITGTIDRDKYGETVIDLYEHGVLISLGPDHVQPQPHPSLPGP